MGFLRFSSNFIALLFAAGSTLLLFFIVLAGTQHSASNILTKWYWVSADTSNISGAPYSISRWSLYGICGYDGNSVSHPGSFQGCTKNKAAYPFDLTRNFGDNVPSVFQQHHNASFYETRFAFAFYLITLFFNVCALFVGVLAGRVRSIAFTSGSFSLLAFIFAAPAASLSTVAFVKARDNFKSVGADAKLGVTLFAFAWVVVFLTFVDFIIFTCLAPKSDGSKAGAASAWKGATVPGGAPAKKRSGYRFGIGSRKTTEGPAKGETSSFVRS